MAADGARMRCCPAVRSSIWVPIRCICHMTSADCRAWSISSRTSARTSGRRSTTNCCTTDSIRPSVGAKVLRQPARSAMLGPGCCSLRGPVSFVAELKQRKVFRVATVFLLVAWIAVQAASIALPAFDAPPWVLRVVILLIALGFPFALVLAWALDVSADGVRFSAGGAGTKRIAVIAALLVVLALAWYFRGQPALRPADTAGTTAAA